jgi:pimeloyl-ACP methyl ester carboxylesterase
MKYFSHFTIRRFLCGVGFLATLGAAAFLLSVPDNARAAKKTTDENSATIGGIVVANTAPEITGEWNGALKIQTFQLRLALHIKKTKTGFSATLDSLDQGAKGIPVPSISFEKSTLKFSIPQLGIQYEGSLGANGNITGVFRQNGVSFPLEFAKTKLSPPPQVIRPQEPAKPYPYHEENVFFESAERGIRLAGTLTLPKKEGLFPAVVLISGSGPQDRNEEIEGHKPFLVIADHLTKNGIAVLRFDDRGTGASTGNFQTATSFDFSKDAEGAIKYLRKRKEINKKKIGLIGHSEGALIAPMIAARSTDAAFIVLLAGTGMPGGQLLLLQQEALSKALGTSGPEIKKALKINAKIHEIIARSENQKQLSAALTAYLKQVIKENPAIKPSGMKEEDFIQAQIKQTSGAWLRYFIKYNPAPALEKVKRPVLALNGAKDLQVPSKANLELIEKALRKGGNRQVTIKEIPGLNHLFQECETGLPSEYETIQQTFSPAALDEILKWIQKQTR